MSEVSKIRIRMGAIEIEYEGSEEFLRADLPELLSAVSELYHRSREAESDAEVDEDIQTRDAGGSSNHGTTTSIAAKLRCESGPDLALAAAARLVFSLKQETFSRQELNNEMKSARSYYKQNMTGNLSKILEGLMKAGKLNEVSRDTYALAQAEHSRIEALLGNG